jgi:hypothetical protein
VDYGLDEKGIKVRNPPGARGLSLRHIVQTGCGAHPVSYSGVNEARFSRVKMAGSESERSFPSNTEVTNEWICTSTPHEFLERGAKLINNLAFARV